LAVFASGYFVLAFSIDSVLSVLSSNGSVLPQQTNSATFFFGSSSWNFLRNFSGSLVHLYLDSTADYDKLVLGYVLHFVFLALTTLTSNPFWRNTSATSFEVIFVAPYLVP
jgi:hypothetical protein